MVERSLTDEWARRRSAAPPAALHGRTQTGRAHVHDDPWKDPQFWRTIEAFARLAIEMLRWRK